MQGGIGGDSSMNQVKAQRNSTFELLRIISMLMIVMLHYSAVGIQHYGAVDSNLTTSWLSGSLVNRLFLCLVAPGGIVGDMIFFMLTGYFLCGANENFEAKAIKKIKPLIIQVLFYSCCFICIGAVITIQNRSGGGQFIISRSLFTIGRGI